MKLNIAIVDDELSDIARLKNFIQNWFIGSEHKLNPVKSYSCGEDILLEFIPGMFQIVFMDILMNKINGIQTAKKMREYDTRILIVFMTASREYAFDAFPVHPFDYVLKPYGKKDVERILNEAMRKLSAEELDVTVKTSSSEHTIPMRMISSVVSAGHNVEIVTTDGKSIMNSMKFKEIAELFKDDSRFILCNRGILVNMSEISSQDNGVFIMKNGTRYPIRVNGQSKITSAFFQYLISKMRAGK